MAKAIGRRWALSDLLTNGKGSLLHLPKQSEVSLLARCHHGAGLRDILGKLNLQPPDLEERRD